MKLFRLTLFVLAPVVLLWVGGCATPTSNIDMQNDRAGAVSGIDYRDLTHVATEMVQSLLTSGRLNKTDGSMYVLAISRIINDTKQKLDTDTLTMQLTEELGNSGKIVVTSAIAANENNRDAMLDAAREMRANSEVNQKTTAKKGQIVAPDLSLMGKIIQRELHMDNGDKQIEYYFQMKITDVASGLQFWQKQVVIGKRADKHTMTW